MAPPPSSPKYTKVLLLSHTLYLRISVIHELLVHAESCASSSAADVLQLLVGAQSAAPGWSYSQIKYKSWAS